MTEEWVVMLHKGNGARGERASQNVHSSRPAALREKDTLQASLSDKEKNQDFWHFEVKRISPVPPSILRNGKRKKADQGFGGKGKRFT
jgi:hypothetical protein